MPNDVRARASLKDDLSGPLARITDKYKVLGRGSIATGIGISATNIAFNAIGNAIHGVTGFLGDSAQAFMDDERSVKQLDASLRANVAGWNGNTDAIERTISARQKLGFSDDDLRDSLKQLVAATGDVDKALEIQRTAMDLARFSGTDLSTASDALTKVEAGSYRILKSLGIQLKAGATQQDALTAVQKIATGQAEEYAATLSGKVAVASERASEASERFGKAIAPIVAGAQELGAGLLEGIAQGFDDITNAAVKMPQDDWAARIEGPLAKTKVSASGAAFEMHRLGKEVHAGIGPWTDITPPIKGATSAIEKGIDPTDTLAGMLHDMGYEADKADTAIGDLATTLDTDLFGKAINEGNLEDLKKTHAELIKQRDAAKEGSREYKILTGRIAENEKAQFDLQYQMAQEEGPDAVISFLDRAKKKYGQNNAVIQAEIDKLRTLWGLLRKFSDVGVISFGRYSGKSIPAFASGVQNFGGGMALVGEKGPELVNLPGGSDVIPNGAISGGGGSLTVNVNVSGGIMTPGVTDEMARTLGPAISKYLQQRGFLGAARAF